MPLSVTLSSLAVCLTGSLVPSSRETYFPTHSSGISSPNTSHPPTSTVCYRDLTLVPAYTISGQAKNVPAWRPTPHKMLGLLSFGEGGLAVGVTGDDEEEVGEAVDGLQGGGVLPGVTGSDEATFRAAHDRAGDVE
jgi:hypothetical protein